MGCGSSKAVKVKDKGFPNEVVTKNLVTITLKPSEDKTLGIALESEEDTECQEPCVHKVKEIVPGSAVESSGLRVNDTIVLISGRQCFTLLHDDCVALIKQSIEDNGSVVLGIRR
eukprot:m.136363 g.136363  ORF g.136363 m.136363 type:complete len:115 (-) comp14730_c1_seq1:49-393(-)